MPYYLTPAAARAEMLLRHYRGNPEQALIHALQKTDDCLDLDDLPQWRYWGDVALMIRVINAVGWAY